MKITTTRIAEALLNPTGVLDVFTRVPEEVWSIRTTGAEHGDFTARGIYPFQPADIRDINTIRVLDIFRPYTWTGSNSQIMPTFSETLADGVRTLSLNVPGCGREDIKITLKNQALRVYAVYGNTIYDCATNLSLSVDMESIAAECKNGILILKMADKEVLEREITVK